MNIETKFKRYIELSKKFEKSESLVFNEYDKLLLTKSIGSTRWSSAGYLINEDEKTPSRAV